MLDYDRNLYVKWFRLYRYIMKVSIRINRYSSKVGVQNDRYIMKVGVLF